MSWILRSCFAMFLVCVFIVLWALAAFVFWFGFVVLLAVLEVALHLPDETLCTLWVASWFGIPSIMASAYLAWEATLSK